MTEHSPLPDTLDHNLLLIRDTVRDHFGFFFPDDRLSMLQDRVAGRMRELGLTSLLEYGLLLKREKHEIQALVEHLVVPETYFLRERDTLQAFREELLPEILLRRRGASLRVWSAGCASGEEPYTLAILLREEGVLSFEVLGTDVSERMLERARHGVYTESSLRAVDRAWIARYFDHSSGGYRVREEIRHHVSFAHLNLVDARKVSFLPRQDAVFLRNVLMYFDPDSRLKVLEAVYHVLSPGGFLALGVSEVLTCVHPLYVPRYLKNSLVYVKPGE